MLTIIIIRSKKTDGYSLIMNSKGLDTKGIVKVYRLGYQLVTQGTGPGLGVTQFPPTSPTYG